MAFFSFQGLESSGYFERASMLCRACLRMAVCLIVLYCLVQSEATSSVTITSSKDFDDFDHLLVSNDLGPFASHGECNLEGFNRCLNILSYIAFWSNKSIRTVRFTTDSWAETLLFTEDHILHWMRGADFQVLTPPDQAIHGSYPPVAPARKIMVKWLHETQLPPPKQYAAYLEEAGLDQAMVLESIIEISSTDTAHQETTSLWLTIRYRDDNEFLWENKNYHRIPNRTKYFVGYAEWYWRWWWVVSMTVFHPFFRIITKASFHYTRLSKEGRVESTPKCPSLTSYRERRDYT
ncbi:hypothetical protein M011DRAFT_524724 [Sporormia fimetaria CBS 119925]|uniref:Uncharacterized protein n=1 Tax=Sporormia fimetaria CBS 119925 TaxID=1340428 RepID=A0A6A6VJS7_9PLEO|nr:hypothetical protein M011DRAFT_524724 [Sporormia fimetaria CBS 119925]